jgi:hypothetical protein
LRDLPNQTRFVEEVLRDALGRTCPVCDGNGRVPMGGLDVTNLRRAGLPPLSRDEALELKRVVHLGHELAATKIELHRKGSDLRFSMSRSSTQLFTGSLRPRAN